jgi:diguanylate cyclase (GGDEF)-like protein/PAS domain S-box-containing protein
MSSAFSLEVHRPILDALPNPVWSADPFGSCTFVNRSWLAFTGSAFAEQLGDGRMDSVHADDRQRVLAEWQRAIATHTAIEIEYRLRRASGDYGWILDSAQPIHDAGGQFIGYLGSCHDISVRREAEIAAREREALMRLLANNVPALISYYRASDLACLFANKAYANMWGWDEQSILGKSVPEIIGAEGWSQIEPYVQRVLRGEAVSYQRQIAPPSGAERTIEVDLIPHIDAAGHTFAAFVLINDITRHHLAEKTIRESEQRLRKFTDATNEGIVFHEKGVITDCNEAVARMMGLAPAQLVGRNVMDFVAPESLEQVQQHVAKGFEQTYEAVALRADGSRLAAEFIGKQMLFRDKLLRMTVVRDITDRKQAEARIQFLAHHDALTQLPNRMLMMDRLELTLANAKRHAKMVGVLFIDLDNFKTVNDSLGHHAGDELLKRVAARIQSGLRGADVVARLGGDEFLVVVSDLSQPDDVVPVAEKLLSTIAEPFSLEGQVLSVSPSIGISIFPRDGLDRDTLIKNADAAMYLAKERGRSNFQFFTPSLNKRAFEVLAMESGIRKAIQAVQFVIHYQPEVCLETGALTGVEALIRWHHPELGLLGPDRFISIAEHRGLIIPIGRWVLEQACKQNRAWQDAGYPKVPVAVNMSPIQFKQYDLAEEVARVLAATGLEGQYLELDLTENLLMEDALSMGRSLNGLKDLGIRLAVDDFGAGYSSLSYLKRYPIDKLKIDRTFVRDIPDDPEDVAITGAMISLAKSLGMRVLAEGVETVAQFEFLRGQKCDEMQGYYVSRPLPPEEFERWMKANCAAGNA